jgi:hypothetical protein
MLSSNPGIILRPPPFGRASRSVMPKNTMLAVLRALYERQLMILSGFIHDCNINRYTWALEFPNRLEDPEARAIPCNGSVRQSNSFSILFGVAVW